jgi:hypothetical protein
LNPTLFPNNKKPKRDDAQDDHKQIINPYIANNLNLKREKAENKYSRNEESHRTPILINFQKP